MPEIFVHNDDDSLHPLERNPVVDENLDNVSEDRFRRTFLRDNTTYIDGLVSSVLDHDSLDTDYERELRATLNDIILVFIQNKINTFNLTDAQYQELALELYALLDDFISNLNPNSSIEDIGLLRNQSRFLNSDYESRQLDRQNILPRSRYSFRYLKNPDSGSIETMQIKSRRAPDINFTSDLSLLDRARDTQRSVSRQIENNMPLFQIENVQTRIDDQDSFDSIVFSDLSDEELRSLDVSSSIEYVYRLLKSSLKIGSNAIGDITNLQADNMYIDALLRGEAPVVCRHIVYLFKIVSDSIRDRQVALLGTRAPLNGVSYFPIAMKNIHHATIGVSRGSYVTSLEPTWSLVRKQASIQNATFSREHGTSIPSIMEQFATSAEGMRQIVTSDVGDQMENSNYYSHQKSEVLEFINLSSPQVLCSKLKAILEGDVDLNNDDWPILVEYLTNYVNKTMNNLITEIPGLLLQQIFSLTEQILDKSVCSNSVCNTRLECLVVSPLRKICAKINGNLYSSPSSYIELVDIDLLQVLVLSDNESELSDSYLLNQYLNLCVDNLGMALGILRSVSRRYIVQSDSIQKLRDRWKVLQGICTDLHITEHTSSLNMAKIYLDQF